MAMNLKMRKIPYSSIVGGGIQLVDEVGVARFQIVVIGTTNGISKEIDQKVCDEIMSRCHEGIDI